MEVEEKNLFGLCRGGGENMAKKQLINIARNFERSGASLEEDCNES